MLLIRPGNSLSVLWCLARDELADPSPQSGNELAREARAPGNLRGLPGPMIALPRLLLPLALTRDVIADAADPDSALQDIRGIGEPMAGWYSTFLQFIRRTEPERAAALALNQLVEIPPADLPVFLESHSELGSRAALEIVNREQTAAPGEQAGLLRARLRLVEGLASGLPADQVADQYLGAIEQSGQKLLEQLARLIVLAQENPGPGGIQQKREALEMAGSLGQDDVEAELSADLAAVLLTVQDLDGNNVEEAIGLLQRALSLIPDGDQRWPAWAGNLAMAFHERIKGDASENWETARDLLERACAATDRNSDPRRWAINQTNYGFLLSERPGGASPADLDRGIEHLRAGLEERSPQANVVDWAYSQLNIGLLYRRRGADGDLRHAEECYRQALAHLHPDDQTQLWATLQNNLADVLLASDPADPDGASRAVTAALEAVDPGADPLTQVRLLRTLGRVEDIRRGKLSSAAVAPRREALQLLAPGQAPRLYGEIGGELVDAYSQLGDWQAAADVFAGMLIAFTTLYDAQASAEGRNRILADSPTLARWAAYALARAGRPEQAIEAIENGRARQLSATLARETADLSRLAAADPQLADHYREALSRFRAALAATDQETASPDAQRRVSAAEHGIQLILQQIRAVPGFEQFLKPMTVTDIREAGGGSPVIYLVSAPAGSYALTVLPEGPGPAEVDAVPVAEVKSTDVLRLVLFDYLGDGAPGLILAQSTDPISRMTLLPAALERITRIQPLVIPVADILARTPGNRAVLIPTGLLGLAPLQAIPVPSEKGKILDDIGELYLAPSAGIFAACRKRVSTPWQNHLIGIADPESSLHPLPGSRAELAAIRAIFETCGPATCAFGPDATRSWFLQHVEAASHLHMGCHGASTPLVGDSRLNLADGAKITIEDLIDGRLEGCRLAVASACQSGHYATVGAADEFTGLPAGFLQAGAACAIASLWQVDDHATALLMVRLYELMLGSSSEDNTGAEPVAALRQARAWLRNLTADQANDFIQAHVPLAEKLGTPVEAHTDLRLPYAAPQYWAAFTAWGT